MSSPVLRILRINSYWMSWNLYLALIPLVISILLFRLQRSRSITWWLGLLCFVAFLPNAPYLLTDIIHLIDLIHLTNSIWLIALVLIPVYCLFIIIGFEAYVLSLINLGYYLNKLGWKRWILSVELLTHSICSIGIYLGRFLRFNSWDFITQPITLARSIIEVLTSTNLLMTITLTFVVVSALYWMMKQLTLKILTSRPTRLTTK